MRLTDCTVRTTIDVIEGKWKPLILNSLKAGAQRYAQLRASVPGASEKVLTGQLRQLETDGVITRTVYPDVPPRVEYRISDYGRTLMPILQAMADWGSGHRNRHDPV